MAATLRYSCFCACTRPSTADASSCGHPQLPINEPHWPCPQESQVNRRVRIGDWHPSHQQLRFFSAEAPTEICETLDPYFCPHDNSSVFRAQALLCFFMPSFAYTKELLDGIFEKWAWIGTFDAGSRSKRLLIQCFDIEHSGTWDANWLSLLARFAKAAHSSLRNLDWTPYSPHLFTHTLRILGNCYLNIGIPKLSYLILRNHRCINCRCKQTAQTRPKSFTKRITHLFNQSGTHRHSD